ncbi:hypothetical protein LCGC14_3082300, partial [marine sediment metagenome]
FMGLNLAESSAASYILLFITMFVVVFLYRAMRMQKEAE